MSLQVVDVKFQPAAASGIAKWIRFLHAKSISAKMWLCPGLDTFEFSPQGRDLPSQWLSLNSCGVKVVFLNGLFDCVPSLVPLSFPIWLLVCAAQDWSLSACPSPSQWGCVAQLLHQMHLPLCPATWSAGYSSGSVALWLQIRWGHLAECEGGRRVGAGYLFAGVPICGISKGWLHPSTEKLISCQSAPFTEVSPCSSGLGW